MIEYAPGYHADGKHTPAVTRCVCGHVMEWHYKLLKSQDGYMSPGFRHQQADTCPSNTCDCSKPEWDGKPAEKLPDVTPRSRKASAA